MKITLISPDTLPLPIRENAPENIIENGKEFSLRNKCSRATGLGKRIWKMATELARENDFDVHVLVPDLNYPGKEWIDEECLLFKVTPYNFKIATWNWSEELDNKLKHSDFVIVQTATGTAFKNCSVLPSSVNLIVDGFVPIYAELPCSILGQSSIARKILWSTFSEQYTNLLRRSNCVLYANDRQYYYYEGQFFAINKLNWRAFKFSPLLKIPQGIDIHDKITNANTSTRLKLLWYGPVYPWYKPEKLLDIAPYLQNTDIDFVGIKHPRYENTYNKFFKKFFDANTSTKNITIIEEFQDNPAELYKEYDAGIILAREWLEDKYSSRGRVLDMISHGLPVLLNRNNPFFIELGYLDDSLYSVTSQTLRKTITKFEKNKSLLKVSDKSHESLQKKLSWNVVMEPLIDYIRRFSDEKE